MSNPEHTPIKALPVNLITGFLGVGKTTAIRRLLANKPEDEHWAVLVNEMGEVGIDGPLLEQDGIAIKQVAGGCMCCVSDLPSKVALNALIREQKPDRLLIEPSGIANPRAILATYRSPEYSEVLDLRPTICLIDPWTLTQPQFFELETFQEQLALSDILLASKADSLSDDELQQFFDFANKLPNKLLVESIRFGAIDPGWLDLEAKPQAPAKHAVHHHDHSAHSHKVDHHHDHDHGHAQLEPELVADEQGVIRKESQSNEAWGCGWIFPPGWTFNKQALTQLLEDLPVPRIKGVLLTDEGWVTVNRMRNYCQWEPASAPADGTSPLEMIALEAVDWLVIDKKLRQCCF